MLFSIGTQYCRILYIIPVEPELILPVIKIVSSKDEKSLLENKKEDKHPH